MINLTDEEKRDILARREKNKNRIVIRKSISFCGTCGQQINQSEVKK